MNKLELWLFRRILRKTSRDYPFNTIKQAYKEVRRAYREAFPENHDDTVDEDLRYVFEKTQMVSKR